MANPLWLDLSPFVPELVLFAGTVILLLCGLYIRNRALDTVATATPLLITGCLYLMMILPSTWEHAYSFNDMLVTDAFAHFAKMLILVSVILVLILSSYWLSVFGDAKYEFYILVLLATLGMMLMVSANHLISAYMAIELVSLSLYVLASYKRDSVRSTEAGIKYFVLGSLASGIMLFGMSFVYGFTGAADFVSIHELLTSRPAADPAAMATLFGLIMMMVGFAFKVSAAPFHMWTPDVYEGAPTPITAFFSTAPKIAALVLFARFLYQPFEPWITEWQQILIVLSIASMIIGAFAALVQTNIKRLLAYSSIGHVGFALMGVAAGTEQGMQGMLIYLAIYLVMSTLAFGCVLLMQRKKEAVEDIEQIAGLAQRHPYFAFALGVCMFSMAGIPPLAGFFGKFYVFLAALDAGLYNLAVIGVLCSVVSAFYYLRIVKLAYFDAPKEPFEFETTLSMKYLLVACTLLIMAFFLSPAPLVEISGNAALALWH